jgi:nitrate/TMAO reductase-like tetraheme cytochrome c subunit
VLEYRQILKAYALMDYAAANIGQREAQLSATVLKDLRQTSPVPLISANLLDRATGKPLFEGWRIVQRGRLKVAVVGVLDPRGVAESLGEGLQVEKMESALARLLPVIRPQVDMVILLAFTDEATLAALARDFYELDVVLGGKVRQPAQSLEKQNRSLIYFTTNEARTLGLLWLKFLGRQKIQAVKNDILFLRDTLPQSAQIEALARDYRDEARRARLNIDTPERLQEGMVPGVRAAATYAGSGACLECHPSAASVWRKSAHARAFHTLVAKGAEADPKCIGCHTVGFGTLSGYRREFGQTKLVDVGCESCHGPGSLHVRQQNGDATVNFKFRPLGAGDCQKCHYGEFSRPFNWEAFWPHVAHSNEVEKVAISAGKTQP